MKQLSIGFVLLLLIVSCSPTKKIAAVNNDVIKELSAKKIFAKAYKNRNSQDYVYIRKASLKFKLDKDDDFTFKGQFKVVRDSIIYGSFQLGLGIEAVRFTITPDSIIILNRIKKEYSVFTMQDIVKRLGIYIDFYDMQDILMGDFFVYGPLKAKRRIFKNSEVVYDNGYHFSTNASLLSPNFSSESQPTSSFLSSHIQSFIVNSFFNTVSNKVEFIENNRCLSIDYSGNDPSIFKYDRMDVSIGDKNNSLSLSLKVQSVNTEKFKVAFSVPSNYKLVSL